jgi:RNA polymerase sigma-B factor
MAMLERDAERAAEDDAWLAEALGRFTRDRNPRLRDEIVERANWLAVRGARRFVDRGEPFDDLLQVARLGLLKSVDRFDPSLGVPFGAYATPTIMGELRRYFRDHTWSVHVSRRAKDLRPMVNTTSDRLAGELGRSPRVSEIAAALDVGEDAVLEALEANNAYRAHSLDPTGSGHTPPVDGGFDGVLDRDLVAQLLDRLPDRERTILVLRFFDGMTQSQIAERIGTSQVHVGRLITSSLAVLQAHLSAAQRTESA